ncbi:non-hydrolyzing UDP-N-acetylglucosamine 2-epimerase [Ekhidna sp. To15]|uniref:non-hydrolyzing UDP-N-acetylglucosamine 2-epimerase n=1 Tax=Ekhidna sp. To15 TaxID=3395267 RepID=UPI003F526385
MKIAPIIHAIRKSNKIEFKLIHTGQHYDSKLSGSFFEDLNIPNPDVNLGVGSGTQAEQTAKIMVSFEKELESNPADYVLVVGDVNSTLACAIVAKKLKVKVIHVEAGLRSFDHEMPEEINRMVVDSISDVLFTTTTDASRQLISEGHHADSVHFVGNVMIDSIVNNSEKFKKPTFDVSQPYFVITLHRPSNVDEPSRILKYLEIISESIDGKAVAYFPMHPRTKSKLDIESISKQIIICDPLPYHEFMNLVKESTGVITDSGGIQEETTFLGVPCLTLRDNTERPETISIGTNELIGQDMDRLISAIDEVLKGAWKRGGIPEKWDGNAAERIVAIIESFDS